MLTWIEITPDYRCNNRCVGCFSVQDDGPSMNGRDAMAALARGRREGATGLWVGGGEPTMRRDLFGIVKEARRLGYTRVKLQTNGMMLSYPEFARRCAEAGVTEVSFSVKGSHADLHDGLARTPGCHALMLEGMRQAAALGLRLEADVLMYRSNLADLPTMIRTYETFGVLEFRLWLLSASDANASEVRAEVPRISDVVPQIVAAVREASHRGSASITSLHTPACTVPLAHHGVLFDAAALQMLVVNPGGESFRLEASPMEGGHYVVACEGCPWRARCRGVRRDYVGIHGESEFGHTSTVPKVG